MGNRQSLQKSLPSLWQVMRRFWPYIRRQAPQIAGSLLALFAGILLRLLEPWPLKFVVDRLLSADQTGRLSGIRGIDTLNPLLLLSLSAIALVAITALRALADYYNTIGFSLIGNRVLTQVRNDLYRHLQCLSLSFHTKARSGDLLVRVIGDVNMLRDITVTAALPLLANLLILIGMAALMFWLHWKLALVSLVTVPLFWFSTVRLSRRIHESASKQRQREGAMASSVAEAIGAIKVVQALSLEERFVQTFLQRSQQSQQEDVKGSRLRAGLGRTVDVLIAIATALALWYGAWLVLNRSLSPGDLLVFLAYLKRALNPLQDFAKYTGRLAKAAAAGERVLDLFDREPEVRDLPGAVPAPPFRGEVCFEGVSFAYEDGQSVLEGVNFVVRPGQHVALVGPSGIGKSTLVNLILRLYDPVQGHVKIDRRDIRLFTLESLRAQMSVVLQDSILFATNVWDNIAYGAPTATPEQIRDAARLANADQFIQALPQGYDTILGERGVTLSHGQRQRIAIARAAVRQAPILIFDEPTVGLDEENERAVIEALERLAQGRTTFVITHNLQMAARANLILYLEDGRVLEAGTHEELLRANGRYAALTALQTGAIEHMPQKESLPGTQASDQEAGNLLHLLLEEIKRNRQKAEHINALLHASRSGGNGESEFPVMGQETGMPGKIIPEITSNSHQNPCLFVVGCPRSGTTLLQRMLDHHPRLAVANDSHFIPRAIEDVPVGVDPVLTPERVERVHNYHRFHRLGLSDAAVSTAAASSHTYSEFVSRLYTEYGRQRGKPLAGEKTPDYVRHLPRLQALFPWVKTIHLIRDGRDVALSALEWARDDKGPGRFALWRLESVAVCALWWRWQVSAGRRDGTSLGPNLYYEVKYEDMIANPEKELRGLAAFLGLPFAPEMLTYHEGKARYEPGLTAKKAWLPPTAGLRDWRAQMSERDVELFEALAGDLLTALGYERSVSIISPEIAKLAERCQNWWDSEIAQQEAKALKRLSRTVVPPDDLVRHDSPTRPIRVKRKENHISSGNAPPIRRDSPTGPIRLNGDENGISPEDAALAQRDPALPGLATALDPQALVKELRALLPAANLGNAQSTYVRYKPGTSCLVAYELQVDDGVVPIYVKAYRSTAEIKLRDVHQNQSQAGQFGPRQFVLEHLATAMFIFPNDAKVRALPILVNAQAHQSLLRRLLPKHPDLLESTARTLAYKPERRYVAQLLAESGSRAIIKLYSETAYQGVRNKTEALESGSILQVARHLGRSDHHNILVSEWLPGGLLSEAIAGTEPDLRAVSAVGTALAELHAQSGDRLPLLTRQAEAVRLLEGSGSLGILCPDQAKRTNELAQRLATQLFQISAKNCPIHGDFYAKQVLHDDTAVYLIDLDEAVRGDPAADLGNFIAHLHRQAGRGDLAPHLVNKIKAALLEGYQMATHLLILDRVELYTAISLLRLAQDPFRYREPDWPGRIRAILERVETLLEPIPTQIP